MDTEAPIFNFETDFAGALPCIPMSVRLKLDECGVKLSLKQWNRFPKDDRHALVRTRCDTPDRTQSYRKLLLALIEKHSASSPELVAIDPSPQWADSSRVPQRILDYTASLGRKAPSLQQWQSLSPLQRFTLYKLTRANHDNDNFLPAMREFGLAE